jgi:hypothetical protein
MTVIHQGIIVGKTLGGEKLLGIKRPIGLAELCMTFVGNGSQLIIMWHVNDFVGCADKRNRQYGRPPSTSHLQRHHQEIIFPVAFVYPIGEIAEVWHTIKLINLNLQPK